MAACGQKSGKARRWGVSKIPSQAGYQGIFSLPGELLAGAAYPFRAVAVIRQMRQLWAYVIIPILVNIVVGSLLYAGLLYAGWQWIDELLAGLPEWAAVFEVLLQVVLVLLLFVVLGFVLLQFGVILGAPWYSLLAEKLERHYLGDKNIPSASGALTIMRDIWDALAFEVKKLLLLIGVGVPVLLLNFAPGVGTVLATVGGLALATTINCLDFFDSSLSRRRLPFRTKLAIIRRCMPASGTFGLVSVGLVSIPLINLLAIPLCVTAGTLFFCERIWERLQRGEFGVLPPEAQQEPPAQDAAREEPPQ
jgi:CysZ protein